MGALLNTAKESSATSVDLITSDYAVGTWRNVLVVDWRESTTGPGARDAHLRLQRLANTYRSGVFYLALVSEHASPPDSEARQALADMLRSASAYVIASSVVFDGAGLRGAFVRGVATGLTMLARPSFPFVVTSLDGAAKLFAETSAARGATFARDRFLVEIPVLRAAMQGSVASTVRPVRR